MAKPLGSYTGPLPGVNDEGLEIRVEAPDGSGTFVLTYSASLDTLACKKAEEKYGRPLDTLPNAAEVYADTVMGLMLERMRFERRDAARGGE